MKVRKARLRASRFTALDTVASVGLVTVDLLQRVAARMTATMVMINPAAPTT
jgi:hypothetical protein